MTPLSDAARSALLRRLMASLLMASHTLDPDVWRVPDIYLDEGLPPHPVSPSWRDDEPWVTLSPAGADVGERYDWGTEALRPGSQDVPTGCHPTAGECGVVAALDADGDPIVRGPRAAGRGGHRT
eukprot:gene47815-9371_t